MGISITKRDNCVILFLVISIGFGANGYKKCPPYSYGPPYSDAWTPSKFCADDEFCCGINGDKCCNLSKDIGPQFELPGTSPEVDLPSQELDVEEAFEGTIAFIILVLILCCPIYCCYRYCYHNTQPGFVYSPAETNTHVVVEQSPPPPSQVPYPSTMPYPQQTPYPPQHATNPYYGGPPPPYNVSQGNFQNASAPTV